MHRQAVSYNLPLTCKNACSCLYFSISKCEYFHALLKWQCTGNRYHWHKFDCFSKSKKNAFSSWSKLFILCYTFCYMRDANFTSDYITNKIWIKLDKLDNHGAENLWITSTLLNSMLRGNVPAWIRHYVIGEKANVTEGRQAGIWETGIDSFLCFRVLVQNW